MATGNSQPLASETIRRYNSGEVETGRIDRTDPRLPDALQSVNRIVNISLFTDTKKVIGDKKVSIIIIGEIHDKQNDSEEEKIYSYLYDKLNTNLLCAVYIETPSTATTPAKLLRVVQNSPTHSMASVAYKLASRNPGLLNTRLFLIDTRRDPQIYGEAPELAKKEFRKSRAINLSPVAKAQLSTVVRETLPEVSKSFPQIEELQERHLSKPVTGRTPTGVIFTSLMDKNILDIIDTNTQFNELIFYVGDAHRRMIAVSLQKATDKSRFIGKGLKFKKRIIYYC